MSTETHLNTALLLSSFNAGVELGKTRLLYSDYDALSKILSHGEYIAVFKGAPPTS